MPPKRKVAESESDEEFDAAPAKKTVKSLKEALDGKGKGKAKEPPAKKAKAAASGDAPKTEFASLKVLPAPDQVHRDRIRTLTDVKVRDGGKCVIYWMSRDQRVHDYVSAGKG
eukprot:Colp12_sorted_trinity150504_noHs@11975